MNNHQTQSTVADALVNAKKLMRLHPAAAARQAHAILQVEPRLAEAHFLLSYALRHLGRREEADLAERHALRLSVDDPIAVRAREAMTLGKDAEAEELLNRAVRDTPNDPELTRLLAHLALRAGRIAQAEYLFRYSLRAAPAFDQAREDLSELIQNHGALSRGGEAAQSGEEQFALALRMNEEELSRNPDDPWVWLSYGHALRIAGRSNDSLDAYRKCVAIDPGFGQAWWAIADLKTVLFSDEDRETMAEAAARDLPQVHIAAMNFALGKAYQDSGDAERAFAHYSKGNELRSNETPFDPDSLDRLIDHMIEVFTQEFFRSRAGSGATESDPIFIVSLPRSGSTLLEQMLAAHSQIEPTDELLELGQIANSLAGVLDAHEEFPDYVDQIVARPAEKLRRLGMTYLINTLPDRPQGKPFFTDKAPPNWLHTPLIQLILPNAKIIDIRRDPMACGFSNFVQLYTYGRGFSYDLEKFGRYYLSYVRLMEHMDRVLPGRIHHMRYEDLVSDTETELRRVFEHLGLPFEEESLRHHESKRAVKTASSEQVRQPVNDRGMHTWKAFDSWLSPLASVLARADARASEVERQR